MSAKRLNKRQLREQQELEELAKQGKVREEKEDTAVGEDGPAEEEDVPVPKKTAVSIFSQLAEGDSSSEPEEESVDDTSTIIVPSKAGKKNKKKKKRKAVAASEASAHAVEDVKAPDTDDTPVAEEISTNNAKRKPRKSNKANVIAKKGKDQAKDMSNMSMDEFSALLASQAKIYAQKVDENGQTAHATVTPIGPLSSLRALLALSAPALDPAVELKRQFGAAAIKAYEAEAGQNGGGNPSASAGARARAQAWNTNFKVRNILVQPKETWPPIARTFTGMTMDVMEAQGRGSKVGGWVHSRAYRRAQYQFLQAVHSYEPNQLMALLQMYPWHIDSLLQLSDVSRHQGDLGQASDFNARALFAFERTAAPIFTSSLTSHLGPPMLNFRRVEDRGFWLAAHRQVNFLGRRGTWRTALEWVKLILGLDPPRDPHGMLLWLDFLSIKSRQHVWFLDCFDKLEAALTQDQEQSDGVIIHGSTPFNGDLSSFSNVDEGKGSLNWCLGLMYARALALRAVEREERREGRQEEDQKVIRSTAALRFAIALHPHVLPALFDKIGVALPAGVSAAHPIFEPNRGGDTLPEILAHIYVARSESLWRDGDTGAWLAKTLKDAWPALTKAFENDKIHRPSCTAYAYQEGIWRHILVSDLPDALRQKLVGLIPRSVTQDSSNLDSYDPLPPLGPETTTYDDEYFAAMQARRGGNDEEDYVDLSADSAAGMMDRLMLAFRNLRGGAGGGDGVAGGGGADWEAAVQGMDDETRQDVVAQMMDIAAQAQNAAGGGGEAAGRMPGTLDGGVEEMDNRHGNEEANGPGRFAALRGFLDRVWGGNEMHNDSPIENEDEDDQEVASDQGVD